MMRDGSEREREAHIRTHREKRDTQDSHNGERAMSASLGDGDAVVHQRPLSASRATTDPHTSTTEDRDWRTPRGRDLTPEPTHTAPPLSLISSTFPRSAGRERHAGLWWGDHYTKCGYVRHSDNMLLLLLLLLLLASRLAGYFARGLFTSGNRR